MRWGPRAVDDQLPNLHQAGTDRLVLCTTALQTKAVTVTACNIIPIYTALLRCMVFSQKKDLNNRLHSIKKKKKASMCLWKKV